jgi:hypothetical protein
MDIKVWAYTATNLTLCHAFKDGRALCNKGIRPRTGPAVGSSTGPYVAHYRTLAKVQGTAYTTACWKCRTKVAEPTAEKPERPTDTKDQLIKAEKLSPVMVQAISSIGRRNISLVKSGTVVALIERGILTTATPRTAGENLLTDKGVQIHAGLFDTEPEAKTTEAHVVANIVVYAEGDKVTAKGRPDLGTGIVREVRPNTYGQILSVNWGDASLSYPAQADTLVRVDTEQAAQWEDVAAGEQFDADLMMDSITADTTPVYMAKPYTVPQFEAVKVDAEPYTPKFTAKIVERDESAEFLARHPEQAEQVIDPHGAHQGDRDKLAKAIAYEFSHTFATWGINEPEPEVKIVPMHANRPRMLEFYQDGSMWSPRDLMAEIRSEMSSVVSSTDTTVRFWQHSTIDPLMWLGWLIGYVMESGKLGTDGWQDRCRGPQVGWAEMGLYSTEPSDETELPAWADIEDGDSFGCSAVIYPAGRYNDAENCGDGITREEYYANGEESGMCAQHRLAAEVSNDTHY